MFLTNDRHVPILSSFTAALLLCFLGYDFVKLWILGNLVQLFILIPFLYRLKFKTWFEPIIYNFSICFLIVLMIALTRPDWL